MPESITPTPEILTKYSVVNGKLLMTANADVRDKIEVEIGDTKQVDFYPQVKIQRWDNEVNFSARLKETEIGLATISFDKDHIIWRKGKIESHFYNLTEGEGGYEFQVNLKEDPRPTKTGDYKIEFTLNTKGLDFFYQPPLIQEYQNGYSEEFKKEIVVSETQVKDLDGNVLVERPEKWVGSWVAYTSENKINWVGGKVYGTNQTGVFFRPKIIDAEGKWAWEELKIENGILSVTISQDFLDKAIYPIRHAAGLLFGYDTAGGSNESQHPNDCIGSLFTSPAGTNIVSSLSFYGFGSSSSGVNHAKALVVLHSNLTIIENGTGTETDLILDWATRDWIQCEFDTHPAISASTDYVLMTVHTNVMSPNSIYYNTGDADQGHGEADNNYASPTNPTDITHSTKKFSIYATYIPSEITTYTKKTTARTRVKIIGTSKTLQSRGKIKTAALSKLLQMRTKIEYLRSVLWQARSRVKTADVMKEITSKARVKSVDLTRKITSRGRIKTADLTNKITAQARMKTAGVNQIIQSKAKVKAGVITKISTRGRVKTPDLITKTTSRARVKTADLSKALQSKSRLKIADIIAPILTNRARVSGLTGDKYTQIRAKVKRLGISKILPVRGRIKTADLSAQITTRGKIKTTQEKKTTARARIEQSNLTKAIRSKARITGTKSKTLTIRARLYIPDSHHLLLGKANIVDIGKTYLYLPASGSSENIPVSFEWYIPSNRWGNNLNFQLQIDKSDDTFADLEVEKRSYQDSGFEYWNGSAWVTFPTSGVANSYAGNLARFITNLTNGLKYWRIRAFVG